MKAMILAAGLGTRLRPLTDNKPKALIPFKAIPLLERIIRNLALAGIDHIIVNVHHFAGQVREFLDQLELPGVKLSVSNETEHLMDTGGALLHAREYFINEKDFLVHNVDVITNLDIRARVTAHRGSDALATLAVKKRPTSRSLLFDENGLLSGWRHNETGEESLIRETGAGLDDYGNSCVQVINKEFFTRFPENRALNLTNMYLELARDSQIRAFIHNEDYWYDVGRYENYLKADKEVF
jgi:NDP-sugar pyrophosphorylase family protein